jgi:hypothetical protein
MAETQTISRRDIETQLIEKCWKDPEFKKQVVANPKAMLEQHLGQKLPEQVKIFIYEEDASHIHFSIPPTPLNVTELSDAELEKVAGGTDIGFMVSIVVSIVASAAGTIGGVTKGADIW